MKQLIDFLPLIVFFICYKVYDIYVASGALIAATAVALGATYLLYRRIEKMTLAAFVVLAIFGTLTIVFHDDRFIKWKVTIVYFLFAATLLVTRFVMKQTLIQKILGKELELPQAVWQRLNMAWIFFFIICGLINIYVAFWLSRDFWMNFKVFGLTGATLLFTLLCIAYIYRFLPKEDRTQ